MKKYPIIATVIVALLLLGFFVPLGSYTTTKGCRTDIVPTNRLHLILGDSIERIKNNDVEPQANVGCSINTKYVLYLL